MYYEIKYPVPIIINLEEHITAEEAFDKIQDYFGESKINFTGVNKFWPELQLLFANLAREEYNKLSKKLPKALEGIVHKIEYDEYKKYRDKQI